MPVGALSERPHPKSFPTAMGKWPSAARSIGHPTAVEMSARKTAQCAVFRALVASEGEGPGREVVRERPHPTSLRSATFPKGEGLAGGATPAPTGMRKPVFLFPGHENEIRNRPHFPNEEWEGRRAAQGRPYNSCCRAMKMR